MAQFASSPEAHGPSTPCLGPKSNYEVARLLDFVQRAGLVMFEDF